MSPKGPPQFPANKPHDTRIPLCLGVQIALAVLMVLVVLTRFYIRAFVKAIVGIDDWIMGVAMCAALAITGIQCSGTYYGTGKHVWDVDPSKGKIAIKFAWLTHVLLPTCASLTKISICVAYLRILPFKLDRTFCYGTIVYLICYWIAATLLSALNCRPVNHFWDITVAGSCIPIRVVLLVPASLNSLTDIIVFLWPARTLWKVRQPPLQRFGLIFVFVVGCIVCVAGICRIWYLVIFWQSRDVFYEAAIIYIITSIELNVGVICGCLPVLKPLLARVFPSIFGSSGVTRSLPGHVSFTGRVSWSDRSPQGMRLHTPISDPELAAGQEPKAAGQ